MNEKKNNKLNDWIKKRKKIIIGLLTIALIIFMITLVDFPKFIQKLSIIGLWGIFFFFILYSFAFILRAYKLKLIFRGLDEDKDSDLAYEFNIKFPKDSNEEQNIALARSFVMQSCVAQKISCDLFCHQGLDQEASHFHVVGILKRLKMAEPIGCETGSEIVPWNDPNFVRRSYNIWLKLMRDYDKSKRR